MIVVSNTSPITNLAKIGMLYILHNLYETIHITREVWNELNNDNEFWQGIEEIQSAKWIEVHPIQNILFVEALCADLHRGEAETIALSLELGCDLTIMDEREGRKWAHHFQLNTVGVIGILIQAKARNLITDVRPYLDQLRIDAGFYIKQDLYERVLEQVGE